MGRGGRREGRMEGGGKEEEGMGECRKEGGEGGFGLGKGEEGERGSVGKRIWLG